ncbi:hypothetical protein [Aeoliella sp.]|uniref:hypothetical protein n=1 Tax=Aeoliella sp. TaxID=2795800 RepID=UPI003CCC1345
MMAYDLRRCEEFTKLHRAFIVGTVSILSLCSSFAAQAQNTADATLELTFTLTGVTITDTLTNNTSPATFETSTEVGDLVFEDIGPNGSTFTGESPSNPPGSIGSASASEEVLLNGLDPFVDDYDLDSFGIGDSLVTTMNASASAQTPGSVFFGQVSSENILYFSVFGAETDLYTFSFDYSAVFTGTLDSTWMPGITLAIGDGDSVIGAADSTIAGPSSEFVVASNYFSLSEFNDSNAVVPLNEMTSGSFDVAFGPGDDGLSISFLSSLVVNAGVAEVPEPSTCALALGFAVVCLAGVGRKRS